MESRNEASGGSCGAGFSILGETQAVLMHDDWSSLGVVLYRMYAEHIHIVLSDCIQRSKVLPHFLSDSFLSFFYF